jgi:hypothetical protein
MSLSSVLVLTHALTAVVGLVAGALRLRRHLWRMSLALLIATLSLYPGQARLFPDWIRQSSLVFAPHLLLVGSMLFWMLRIRARRQRSARQPRGGLHEALVGPQVRA